MALIGPTASGKSDLAVRAVRSTVGASVELVSVDSMAVYRGMDIGTARPTAAVRAEIPVHLLDLVEPSDEFTVQQFQRAADSVLSDIARRGSLALLVGGTGLYLRSITDRLTFPGRYRPVAEALTDVLDSAGPEGSPAERAAVAALHQQLQELDPLAAGRIQPSNRRRLVRALEVTLGSGRPFSSFGPGLERYPLSDVAMVGVAHEPEVLDQRIAERFHGFMDAGLLDEVRALAARVGGLSSTARQALGYRELLAHLEEGLPLVDAVDLAIRRTRTLARRQMAWFRRDPRIVWLDGDDDVVAVISSRFGSDPTGSPRRHVRTSSAPVSSQTPVPVRD